MSGWIKLHRSLLDWEWWDDISACRVLVYLLCAVNYEDKKWKGITIKAGSMVLSWDTLSRECGLTPRQCRTAMEKLENSGEVTRHVTNRFQYVSLVKWEKLQQDDRQMTGNKSARRQADDRQMTATKEYKEIKEVKEDIKLHPNDSNKSMGNASSLPLNTDKVNSNNKHAEFPREVIECAREVVKLFPEKVRPTTKPQQIKWLDCIDKCNRIDGYSFDDIVSIIKWARSDDFWQSNFMSVLKLRKTKDGVRYIHSFNEKMKAEHSRKSKPKQDAPAPFIPTNNTQDQPEWVD